MYICEDLPPDKGDDFISAMYVTSSGDVYCWRCGSNNQHEIERQEEAEALNFGWDDYPHSWYDPDLDFGEEDSTHVYIGEDDE